MLTKLSFCQLASDPVHCHRQDMSICLQFTISVVSPYTCIICLPYSTASITTSTWTVFYWWFLIPARPVLWLDQTLWTMQGCKKITIWAPCGFRVGCESLNNLNVYIWDLLKKKVKFCLWQTRVVKVNIQSILVHVTELVTWAVLPCSSIYVEEVQFSDKDELKPALRWSR